MRRLQSSAPADLSGEPILPGDGSPDSSVGHTVIELSPDEVQAAGERVDGALVTPTDDGGSVVDLNPENPKAQEPTEHDANLAEYMDSTDCNGLGSELAEAVDDDRASRAEWEDSLARGMELLGMKIEERTYPFKGASGVFDPLLSKAVLRWQATGMSELLPPNGPVKTKVTGSGDDDIAARAERMKAWFNLYLTELAPEYYPDFDQMLFWLPLVGSTFKKVYLDPILGRPVAPFITSENFIVSYTTTDLFTCPRATNIIQMTKRDLRWRQLSGDYCDIDLGTADEKTEQSQLKQEIDNQTGQQPVIRQGDDRYTLLEVHADLNLKGYEHRIEDTPTDLPLPYIVTIDQQSKQVLAIRRNWKQGDERYTKIPHFVHYKFLPGLGFYGFGYAHILGGSAKAATSLRRQLIDSGTLNNFPGGLRVKGMKFEDNNLGIGPTEFREVDTGGLPIQNAIMTMPYKEPSPVLLQMLEAVDEGADQLAGTQEIAVGEGRQDAPVGTTVALMEAALKIQSSTIKRQHVSLRQEFKLFRNLFGEHMPEEPYPFPVPGGVSAIMRADFTDDIDVIPVSDPNITSSAQRAMLGQMLLQSATQAPQIHDLREAYQQYYQAIGVDPEKIAKLLPPPQQTQPMDPLSENMAMLTGKPVAVGPTQNHDAHIASHMPLTQQPGPAQQAALAHIADHQAQKMRLQIENILGMPLPPAGMPLPPPIEDQIAMLVAKAMQVIAQQQQAQSGPSATDLALQELQLEAQRIAADVQKAREANTVKAFGMQLQAQTKDKDRRERLVATAMKTRAKLSKPKPKAVAGIAQPMQ